MRVQNPSKNKVESYPDALWRVSLQLRVLAAGAGGLKTPSALVQQSMPASEAWPSHSGSSRGLLTNPDP